MSSSHASHTTKGGDGKSMARKRIQADYGERRWWLSHGSRDDNVSRIDIWIMSSESSNGCSALPFEYTSSVKLQRWRKWQDRARLPPNRVNWHFVKMWSVPKSGAIKEQSVNSRVWLGGKFREENNDGISVAKLIVKKLSTVGVELHWELVFQLSENWQIKSSLLSLQFFDARVNSYH